MQPERIEFPSDYPIKVVLKAREGLRESVDAVFARHFGPQPVEGISERQSSQGHFTALTYTPRVQGEEQLHALHAELSALDGVMLVL